MVLEKVSKIFSKKEEEQAERKQLKADQRILRLTDEKTPVVEKKRILDALFKEDPKKLAEREVLDTIASNRELVKHVVLREYHVSMGRESYAQLKTALRQYFLKDPDTALDLLTEIARTNMKRKESVDRTLDIFSDVFRAATRYMDTGRSRKFIRAYGLLRRRVEGYTETDKEFVRHLLAKMGPDIASALVIAAKVHADLAKNAEDAAEFKKHYNTYHAIAKDALFILQKTLKHTDRELAEKYHGSAETFAARVRKVVKNLWHDVDYEPYAHINRKIRERVNLVTKTINRGIQRGVLDERTATSVLKELADRYGADAEDGLIITLRDTKSPEMRKTLLTQYLKSVERHVRNRAYAGYVGELAERISRELGDAELAEYVRETGRKRIKMHR